VGQVARHTTRIGVQLLTPAFLRVVDRSEVDLLALGRRHGHVDAPLAIGALAAFTPVGVGSPNQFVAMGAVEFDTHG
jgi:hypothetical protein